MINQEHSTRSEQPESYGELIERLAAIPPAMIRLIGDRSNDDLRQPGRDGGLGVVEILCDQQDWEEITGDRVARMLYEDCPHLEAYDDSLWSIEHDYAARNSDDVMESFARMRQQLVETLRGFDDDAWQRTGTLGEHGVVTIAWLLQRALAHDETHIAEIMEALA